MNNEIQYNKNNAYKDDLEGDRLQDGPAQEIRDAAAIKDISKRFDAAEELANNQIVIKRQQMESVATIFGKQYEDQGKTERERFPIPSGTVGLVSGSGGTGKSFLVLRWMLDIGAEATDHSRTFYATRKALYITVEDDRPTVNNRMFDMGTYKHPKNLTILTLPNEFGLNSSILSLTDRQGVYDETPFYKALNERIATGGYSIVFIDPLSRFIPEGMSENDNAQMTKLIDTFQDLVNGRDCSIVLITHSNKAASGQGAGNIRGASALVDGVRWACELSDPIQSMINGEKDIAKSEAMTLAKFEAQRDSVSSSAQPILKCLRFTVVKANRSKPIYDYYVMTEVDVDGASIGRDDSGRVFKAVLKAVVLAQKPLTNIDKEKAKPRVKVPNNSAGKGNRQRIDRGEI